MLKRLLLTVAVLTITPATAPSAFAQQYPELWCANFYPGATYEELLWLCANDTPGDGFPDDWYDGSYPWTPPKSCQQDPNYHCP